MVCRVHKGSVLFQYVENLREGGAHCEGVRVELSSHFTRRVDARGTVELDFLLRDSTLTLATLQIPPPLPPACPDLCTYMYAPQSMQSMHSKSPSEKSGEN